MMANLYSQRGLLYMLLVSYLGFALYIASSYKAFRLYQIPSSLTESIATTTVTVFAHETATPSAVDDGVEEPLQSHTFRPDGLLEVNADGRHPIYDLIERAETEWDRKLRRQSKSLDEAVAEYERRYHRAPPKGFDEWWFYCERNNVQLPDEYDRIYNDLEPFWGMDPIDLQRLQLEAGLETYGDSFTLGKVEGSEVTLIASALPENDPEFSTKFHLGKAKQIMDILNKFSEFIPSFKAVFSPHDNPNMLTDWELKTQALAAAANETFIDVNNPPPVKNLGWPSACSPESRLRHTTFNPDVPPSAPTEKTFIYDHIKSMDPCTHPSLLYYHGQFLRHHQGPTPNQVMIPMFSYCSTTLHHNIVSAVKWVDPPDIDPDFPDRLDERLSWRGTTTGMEQTEDTMWRNLQRIRLVGWANERNGTASVLQPTKSKNERVGEGRSVSKARFNPAMLDVAFVGKPNSCMQPVCDIIENEFEFRKYQNAAMAANYKYVLDVDGNGWSSRFRRLMMSHSLIFKSTVFPEWFQERIQPWKHYVPVNIDLSDLYDSLTFFRGDLYGQDAHYELAAEIALAGRDWAKSFWREEDMAAYMFRLFLEYGRVMSLDRHSMSYEHMDSAS